MSRLEELISELCPDGVKYRTLEEVINYEQPTKYIVSSTEYDDNYSTPVLTAGQTFILGYTNETGNIYNASKDKPVIIFDDFTTSFHWVNFDFKIKSSAMKILLPRNADICNFRYAYYAMRQLKYTPSDHKRHWIGIYSKLLIPLPPLPVQEKIVRILDGMDNLICELQHELEQRKKQYEYYLNVLLSQNNNVEWLKLGDIGKVSMCKRILKSETSSSGEIPFYKIGTFGKEPDSYISKSTYLKYKEKYSFPNKGDILLSASGTIGRTVIYDGTPSYYQDSNIVWLKHDEKTILNKYLYYFYQLKPWKVAEGGTISRLYNDIINKTVVPVPCLKEQQRIVDILDRFDALCNDPEKGLPAEIALRQKQYEYYRDKLLTFKEKKA